MIIYDNEKYACVMCIRGHRSSGCRHTSRMLVKVRSRGRPSPVDMRKVILVDSTSQVPTPPESKELHDKEELSCNGMDNQPILFLRAIEQQQGVFVNGQLRIIIEHDESKKYVSEKEFLQVYSSRSNGPNCRCQTSHSDEPDKSTVELFTPRGLYLSSACSCPDDDCQCSNCVIHRNESELNMYIQQSGVPLTQLGAAHLFDSPATNDCKCSAEECQCVDCAAHRTEIVSFDSIIVNGLFNVPLKRKTLISFRNKLIPSKYWWDFFKLQLPLMSRWQLECLNLVDWLDKIIGKYGKDLDDTTKQEPSIVQPQDVLKNQKLSLPQYLSM